jgi:hypothetical protein
MTISMVKGTKKLSVRGEDIGNGEGDLCFKITTSRMGIGFEELATLFAKQTDALP